MWFPMGGGGGGGGDQGEEQKPTPRPPPMVTTTGYWYSDHHHQIPQPPAEICGSYSNPGMEMVGWKSFLNKAAGAPSSSSSSKAAAGLSGDFNAHHHHHHHQDFCSAWVDHGDNDSSSSLRCVFPCEGNERPSHGLSLSLSSANPSAIGLQPFELRAAANPVAGMNHGFFSGKPVANHLEINNTNSNNCGYYEMRESKYLGAAQELLNEFCSLGTSESSGHNNSNNGSRIKKKMACNQWQEGDESTTHNAAGTTSACNRNPCLDSLDLLELHNTQTKLLHMLQEVDRRYKQYCDEMKAVVSSFEAVAGDGAGKGYAASAAKAMSRHFRCLRDGIVAQLKEVKKAAAEKDHTAAAAEAAAGGTTKGETPRLKVLDQALRQQKALQQMSMMEAHPWRPQRGLPERSVSVLRAWLFEHFLHPYPSDVDKHILARQTGLSRSQVSNWFINARVRLWKPMVEEMYQEETKEQEYPLIANSSSDDANAQAGGRRLDHRNPRTASDAEDHKPNNLVRVDISSILNNNNNNNQSGANVNDELDRWPIFGAARGGGDHRSFAPAGLADGDVGFPSLPHPAWAHGNPGGSFGYGARAGGGGGGVSLTLGLQQQGGSGMGLAAAFSASTAASSSSAGPPPSLFYARSDQMEDCQTVPYPLLDSEGQNLPYRNLTGAQLLHDLAGQ